MPGASLLTLLDDIATVLDDVGLMTKVAAQKTAGVLGDDLALNAQQVAGVRAERELPVVWAVAKGSAKNKLILVPAALGLSAVAPWSIMPVLMLGGTYLCFEGFEKLAHAVFHSHEDAAADEAHTAALVQAVADPAVDMVAFEREKIEGAVRTDFILSAEIIVITLGTVAEQPLPQRLAVLAAVGLLMTVGVYGLVGAIVKLDDVGGWLARPRGKIAAPARALGRVLIAVTPWLMRSLTVIGTAAMFLVGGGILVEGLPPLEHLMHDLTHERGGVIEAVGPTLFKAAAGILAGAAALGVVKAGRAVLRRVRPAKR